MIKLWNRLSKLGVHQGLEYPRDRQLVLSNKLNVIMTILGIILLFAVQIDVFFLGPIRFGENYIYSFQAPTQIVSLIIIGIANLLLNKYNLSSISKPSLLFLPLYFLIIHSLTTHDVIDEYYFWYPIAPIPFLLLPIWIYDIKSDLVPFILSVIYSLGLIFFAFEILDFFADPIPEIHVIVAENLVFYKLAPLVIAIFLFLAVYYMTHQIDKSTKVLSQQNVELNNTIKELKHTQKHLIISEKMATIGRMSSELTHELNTPIAAIKGNLTIMHEDQHAIQELWSKASGQMTRQESEITYKLIERVLGQDENSDRRYGEEIECRSRITEKLRKAGIPEDRHLMIADYFVEFRMEDIEPYLPLLQHDDFQDILEIVYCENSIHRSTHIANTAIQNAERLINKLRTYSFKKGWEKEKPYQLSQLVQNSLDLHESKLLDVDVDLNLDKDLPTLWGYPDEIIQVVNNLVSNAIDAMDARGQLSVAVKRGEGGAILEVLDSGGGIQADEDQDIFEPFYTTKKEGQGTGLGLNICKEIISKHDGSILWKNEKGGALFTVDLPVREPA